MGVPLDKFLSRFSPEERRVVDARAQALIAEEMSLRDLRKAMGKTQAAMAEKLGLKQENISRVEKRADMLLSTLDGYLRAMGGQLRLVVEFEDRAPVRLSGLADIGSAATHRTGKPASAKPAATKARASRPERRKAGQHQRPASSGGSRSR